MIDHVEDKWYCCSGSSFLSRSQRYLRACHQIWKCIIPKHPIYDMEDLGDDAPGYSREPVTSKTCEDAWRLLNELFMLDSPILDWCLEIYPTTYGSFEFEWYFNGEKNCFIELTNFEVEKNVKHRLSIGRKLPGKPLAMIEEDKVNPLVIDFLLDTIRLAPLKPGEDCTEAEDIAFTSLHHQAGSYR